jgi:hypothetical protein
MQKVTVYFFTGYQISTDKIIRSKRMATLEAIKKFGCTPIMDTAKEVYTHELDDNGRYPKNKSALSNT